jgi:hypothetical protein
VSTKSGKSGRGHMLLDENGFGYHKDTVSKKRLGWKCCKYYKLGCKARLSTLFDNKIVYKAKAEHNHNPEVDPMTVVQTTDDPLEFE